MSNDRIYTYTDITTGYKHFIAADLSENLDRELSCAVKGYVDEKGVIYITDIIYPTLKEKGG